MSMLTVRNHKAGRRVYHGCKRKVVMHMDASTETMSLLRSLGRTWTMPVGTACIILEQLYKLTVPFDCGVVPAPRLLDDAGALAGVTNVDIASNWGRGAGSSAPIAAR